MSSAFADKTFSKESSSSSFGGWGSSLSVSSICFFNISCFLSLKVRSCSPIVSSPNDVVWLALDKSFKKSKLFETGDGGGEIKLVGRVGGGQNVGGGGSRA